MGQVATGFGGRESVLAVKHYLCERVRDGTMREDEWIHRFQTAAGDVRDSI